jgi:hypothetical protein
MNDAPLESAIEQPAVMWSGGLVLEDPQRDGPDLARMLTEPPFTKVEVLATDSGSIIRAEYPRGDRVLSSQAFRILLERILEHTGADMRTGPFHPRNYRKDDFLGDLRWDEDDRQWHFGTGAGVSGRIRPPDPPELPEPPLTLLVRWWRGIQGRFHSNELQRKRIQELSDRCRDMDIGPQLEKAKSIVATIDAFKRQVKEGAADHLHELFNSNWSDGKFVDRREFIERITLNEFLIEPDGAIKAWLDDGELFRLHDIVVFVDSSGNVTNAHLEG